MGNKVFIGIIAVLTAGLIGFVALSQDEAPKTRPGQAQPDKGRQHITTQGFDYGTDFPTSGPHSPQPASAGAYKQEIPNENLIHSMEHGGVVITYSPDLDPATITKIERLFTKPFSNPKFTPTKAIVAPYSKNDKPIILRSWTRILKLDAFNEQTMIDYYLTNVNKSPEPGAQV